MSHRLICFVTLVIGVGLCPAAVRAAFVQWDIDAAQSKVTLAIPDQDVTFTDSSGNPITANARVRNQSGLSSSWTAGNTAFFDGLLNSNDSEGADHTIQFLSNPIGQVIGLNSGNYPPNPAAYNPLVIDTANPDGTFTNTTAAAGVFGAKLQARVSIVTLDMGFMSFYNTSLDLVSNPLVVSGTTGGTFDAIGATFGLANSDLAVDGLNALIVGQVIPDTLTSIQNVSSTATIATASITNLGGLNRRLNLTMTVPGTIDFQGTLLNLTTTTTIVANGIALFPGDVDMNSLVEFSDLNTLLTNYGLPGTWVDGDFDHTGFVDFTDLNMLLTNYGLAAPVSGSISPVPEPNAIVLAGVGLCAVAIAARRRSAAR